MPICAGLFRALHKARRHTISHTATLSDGRPEIRNDNDDSLYNPRTDPVTCHEGTTRSLTSALDWCGWLPPRHATPRPLYTRERDPVPLV